MLKAPSPHTGELIRSAETHYLCQLGSSSHLRGATSQYPSSFDLFVATKTKRQCEKPLPPSAILVLIVRLSPRNGRAAFSLCSPLLPDADMMCSSCPRFSPACPSNVQTSGKYHFLVITGSRPEN